MQMVLKKYQVQSRILFSSDSWELKGLVVHELVGQCQKKYDKPKTLVEPLLVGCSVFLRVAANTQQFFRHNVQEIDSEESLVQYAKVIAQHVEREDEKANGDSFEVFSPFFCLRWFYTKRFLMS